MANLADEYITLDVNRNGAWNESYVRRMFPQAADFQTYNFGRGLDLRYPRDLSKEAAREAWAFTLAEQHLFGADCMQPHRAAPTPEQEDTLLELAAWLWPLFRDDYLLLDMDRCTLTGMERAPHYVNRQKGMQA